MICFDGYLDIIKLVKLMCILIDQAGAIQNNFEDLNKGFNTLSAKLKNLATKLDRIAKAHKTVRRGLKTRSNASIGLQRNSIGQKET